MSSMVINRNDIREIEKILDKFGVDSFKLIQRAESGIGYTLETEFNMEMHGRTVNVRVPVVGIDNW